GVQNCYIWFIPVGATQAEMTISDVAVYTFVDDLAVEPPTSSSSEATSSSETTSSSSSSSSSQPSESSTSSIESSSSSTASSTPSEPSSSESTAAGSNVAVLGISGGVIALWGLGVFFIVKKGKKLIK
ncbi:MAG: hypothetical protein NTV44_02475, partial [Firmicutes bacterium]|nr:hypothetical protein [Bacillota bacterium]